MMMYKLMILYLLRKVNCPLSNSHFSVFFLDKSYTNYFTLQKALNELLEAKLIRVKVVRDTSLYDITSEGEEAFTYFGNKLGEPARQDMDEFIDQNGFKIRNDTSVLSDYYKSTNQDFIVNFEIREGKLTLLKLELSVPTESQAVAMSNRWRDKSREVYSFLMESLM